MAFTGSIFAAAEAGRMPLTIPIKMHKNMDKAKLLQDK
jgi:hypothetical protein